MSVPELPPDPSWIDRFHAGDFRVLDKCYRNHFATALTAARRIVSETDAETVTHEVFYRLLTDGATRRGFSGGKLGAWISKLSTNAAIDHHRRRSREVGLGTEGETSASARVEDELEAKRIIERFCEQRLQPKWKAVFEMRFLRQLSQREAARELGIERSTLAYQEQEIRAALRRFLLASEES